MLIKKGPIFLGPIFLGPIFFGTNFLGSNFTGQNFLRPIFIFMAVPDQAYNALHVVECRESGKEQVLLAVWKV